MKKNLIKIISLMAVASVLLSACAAEKTLDFSASGTFSAIETTIAPEISGKVVEVSVNEGDEVEVGQTLFKIDDEVIRAQYDQAVAAAKAADAAVEAATQQAASADAQYQLTLQAALMQDIPARTTSWRTSTADDYRPAWYFNKAEQIDAAQAGITSAEKAFTAALGDLEKEQKDASSKDFMAAEKRLAEAENALSVANSTLDQMEILNNQDLEDAAEEVKETAQAEFDSALAEYDRLLTDSAADAVIQARSRVAVAQTNLDNARSTLLGLQTGDQSLQVVAAQKAAEAAASALKQAEAMREQAQKAQTLAQLQLDRATVKAPVTGVVLTRSLEVGDLAVAGGSVMRIAQLDTLDLVVYLPEDQYGKVNVGDVVNVTVDSFSGEIFKGSIVHIADEAEFTPRNVQTESGRKATVYAVKVQVPNEEHRLKPGMPADVEFIVR